MRAAAGGGGGQQPANTRHARRLGGLAAGIFLLTAATGRAQDAHYWNSQYGPRAILLGGAVIGSISDMSATYYNPGALGYIQEPELLLSANVFQNTRLTVRDGAGAGVDLTSSDFQLLPNMLAGAFDQSWLGNNKFAYSFLTRHRFEAEVIGNRTAAADVLPAPGVEQFAGGLKRAEDASELWAGVTWARGLGPRVGVGVSQFVSIRVQDSEYRFLAQALTDSGRTALVLQVDNHEASVYSLLWKAGVGFDLGAVTAGLTLTTPNVRLFGSGSSTLDATWVGVDRSGDGAPDDGFEANVQTDVRADYESPLSVGVGAALHLEKTRFQAAAEWFSAVDRYDVLSLQSFRSQATGDVVTPRLQHRFDAVVNWAIGVEHRFRPGLAGLASFTADRSAFNAESDVAVTPFDIYHVSGGAMFNVGKPRITLGLAYAWGSEEITQLIELDPDSAPPAFVEERDLLYDRFTFIFGFGLNI
jgi:hypothetical protein